MARCGVACCAVLPDSTQLGAMPEAPPSGALGLAAIRLGAVSAARRAACRLPAPPPPTHQPARPHRPGSSPPTPTPHCLPACRAARYAIIAHVVHLVNRDYLAMCYGAPASIFCLRLRLLAPACACLRLLAHWSAHIHQPDAASHLTRLRLVHPPTCPPHTCLCAQTTTRSSSWTLQWTPPPSPPPSPPSSTTCSRCALALAGRRARGARVRAARPSTLADRPLVCHPPACSSTRPALPPNSLSQLPPPPCRTL